MGIVVLALAVLPRLRVGGRQLFETEAPGPEIEPLSASIRDTARRLWVLYVALTVVCATLFAVIGWTGIDPEMDLYDAVTTRLHDVAHRAASRPTPTASEASRRRRSGSRSSSCSSAASTSRSCTSRSSRGRVRTVGRDEELRLYAALVVVSSIVMVVALRHHDVLRGEEAFRHGVFQAVSIITTTGFATVDYADWPPIAAMAIVGLMFIGGSAGSTTGSVKIVRHLLIGRILRRELDQTVHPEVVTPVRLNRRALDERALRAVIAFVLLYIGLFVIGAILIAIDSALGGLDVGAFDAIAASASMIGNVGPGFGFAGPYGSFARVQRLLEERDDRAHVARAPRADPGARALHAAVLAGVAIRVGRRRAPDEVCRTCAGTVNGRGHSGRDWSLRPVTSCADARLSRICRGSASASSLPDAAATTGAAPTITRVVHLRLVVPPDLVEPVLGVLRATESRLRDRPPARRRRASDRRPRHVRGGARGREHRRRRPLRPRPRRGRARSCWRAWTRPYPRRRAAPNAPPEAPPRTRSSGRRWRRERPRGRSSRRASSPSWCWRR